MADGQTLSLREQLQATHDELSAREPAPSAGETDASEAPNASTVETGAEPAPGADNNEAAAQGASPERDEQGRFKAKGADAAPNTPSPAEAGADAPPVNPQSAAPAGQEPPQEAIPIPPSLPAAVKAKFANLDPDVRDAFVSLEKSVQTAKAEWGAKGQRLNRFDEILGPHVDRWRMNGLDEYSGIQSLIAAQSLLDRDPVSGIAQIARSYGLSPAHLAQAFGLTQQTSAPIPGQEGQPPPTASPDISAALHQALAPLQQGLQTLQQQYQQDQQASQAARIAEAQNVIDAFAADPANMYFHNVQDAVTVFLQEPANGRSLQERLKDAYDRAIWADPSVRPLLLQSQQQAAAAETARKAAEAKATAEKAARDKAEAARKAAGSVTGSPSPGAGPPAGAPRPLREELAAAYQAAQQQL